MAGPVSRERQLQPGIPKPQVVMAPNWFLGLVPRQFWSKKKTVFFYEGDFATAVGILPQGNLGPDIAANGSATGTINIQQDSHFLCVAGVGIVTSGAGVTLVYGQGVNTPSQKQISIADAGPGQPLSNVLAPFENYFGTGQLPAVWPIPKLFEAGGGIAVNITNLNQGTAHSVRMTFWGVRIYYKQEETGEVTTEIPGKAA